MRVAIIGAGISGLTGAWRLRTRHDVRVFEAGEHIGGHTHTHDIELRGRTYRIDTGFIVHNDRTYPHFLALMADLGVQTQKAEMSFSVQNPATGLEYAGTNLDTLFAQRRNLLRPGFYAMLLEILRFNREAPALLDGPEPGPTLGEYLREHRFSRRFIDDYLAPMGAAIWSSPTDRMGDFPARAFVRFFRNHGLLSVNDRPQWYVLKGGSRDYVDRMLVHIGDRVHAATPVQRVVRDAEGVTLSIAGAGEQRFDAVVIATHSDQALALLADPSPQEREVLGAIAYQDNDVVLHTDVSLMPRNRRAWASWNYRLGGSASDMPTVTYDMNRLQSLDAPETFCVSLNQTAAIAPDRIIKVLRYAHPVYTRATIAAQSRKHEIDGVNRTWYCGAYWRYGFHEDGVVSALDAIAALGGTDGPVAHADIAQR